MVVLVLVFLLYVEPLSTEQGAISKRGMLRKGVLSIGVRCGVRLLDDSGFSLFCAHGFIVFFRCILVAAHVPAQLADVTVSEKQIQLLIITTPALPNSKKDVGLCTVLHFLTVYLSSSSPIWC